MYRDFIQQKLLRNILSYLLMRWLYDNEMVRLMFKE